MFDEDLSASCCKFQGKCVHVVLIKGKPIPEGLKLYVLTENTTGFILNAFLHHSKLTTDKQDYGTNFGIVLELLEGNRLGSDYCLLDQGYTVSQGLHNRLQCSSVLHGTFAGSHGQFLYQCQISVGAIAEKYVHHWHGADVKERSTSRFIPSWP